MQNSQKETGVNYQFSAKYLVIPTYKKSFLCIKNILQKRYFTWSLLKKSVFYQRFQNILSFETSMKNQRDVCLKPFFSIWVPGEFGLITPSGVQKHFCTILGSRNISKSKLDIRFQKS